MPSPSQVFRQRLRQVRQARNWTQPELAAKLSDQGAEITAFTINRLENSNRGVSLDEAVAIAAVLGPSLLHIIVPLDDRERIDLTPQMPVRPVDARAWLRGQRPLQQADEQIFYFQTPPGEANWFPYVPGPWRFENRKDYEATRHKWEREILSRGALPRDRDLLEGPDAEDIEPTRPARRPPDHEDEGEDHR